MENSDAMEKLTERNPGKRLPASRYGLVANNLGIPNDPSANETFKPARSSQQDLLAHNQTDNIMPSLQKPFPESTDWRTFGLMAIIYAIPAIILRLDVGDQFNYAMAGLGAVSYVFVEGASQVRRAQRSYELPRNEKGYRADWDFVTCPMKALAGFLYFGAAFGDVQVARMVPVHFGLSALLSRSSANTDRPIERSELQLDDCKTCGV
jgi:hypothetical protein